MYVKYKSNIDYAYKLIEKHNTFCLFKRWFDNLLCKITDKKDSIVTKKITKLNRDLEDFQLDRVYT